MKGECFLHATLVNSDQGEKRCVMIWTQVAVNRSKPISFSKCIYLANQISWEKKTNKNMMFIANQNCL